MRWSVGALLIGALVLVSCSSDKRTAGISGNYMGTQNFGIGQAPSAMLLSVRQQGASITGAVTPPFQTGTVSLLNGSVQGSSLRFDAIHGNLTFHYDAVIQGQQIQGSFEPLGCVMPGSGQPCVTDSDGTFTVQKQ